MLAGEARNLERPARGTMLTTITSTSLLEGLKDAENDEVWQDYVGRYRPLLVRYAARSGVTPDDAEDVAQATLHAFCVSYREGRYDRRKGRLRAWLLGIAQNQVRRFKRRPSPERQAGAEFFDYAGAPAAPEQDEVWEQEWQSAVLRQCLEEIRREVKPRTFEAFERFALAGESAARIAEDLGVSENAVFLAKRRILRRVREIWPLMAEIF